MTRKGADASVRESGVCHYGDDDSDAGNKGEKLEKSLNKMKKN